MKKIILFLLLTSTQIFPQIDNPLDYFPHHVGDTWQYRSQFTGEIVGTRYIDSVRVDALTNEIFISIKNYDYPGTNLRYIIDSLGNLYNLDFNPQFIRLKLYADPGDKWVTGFHNGTIPVFTSVTNKFSGSIFNQSTIIKSFTTEIDSVSPFWLGTDYLAKGFGVIRIEIEPSDVYVLTGAIIDSVEYGIITSIEDDYGLNIPYKFLLQQNYPNPFNPTTKIKFTIPNVADAFNASTTNVLLKVYDVLGNEIATLVDEHKPPGTYEVEFDARLPNRQGSTLPSGIYFYSITSGKFHDVKKMVLMK